MAVLEREGWATSGRITDLGRQLVAELSDRMVGNLARQVESETASEQPELHDDGARWTKGLTSTPKSWTLIGSTGDHLGHVYPGNDRTWTAVWDDGAVIAHGLATSGEALRAVDDVARPCAYAAEPCDSNRMSGSPFCPVHLTST
jgi:hypothetical protein